jgi:hypothetical protein
MLSKFACLLLTIGAQTYAAKEGESGVIELPLYRTTMPLRSLQTQNVSTKSTLEHAVSNN